MLTTLPGPQKSNVISIFIVLPGVNIMKYTNGGTIQKKDFESFFFNTVNRKSVQYMGAEIKFLFFITTIGHTLL